ncbi:MAG: PrgI family protein [Candidatus Buchananbacteria bacterium]|nr:PrgI family protein [Candidatus Buchananbacteria bacterium]
MQQFVVPQFIGVEDKVIGPVTVRQFVILLVGGGLLFIAYRLSDLTLFLIELVLIGSVTIGIAFIKVNGKPVHYLLLNLFETFRKPRIRVWQRKVSSEELKLFKENESSVEPTLVVKKNQVRASRLAELALVVDTGGVYQGESAKLPNEELV